MQQLTVTLNDDHSTTLSVAFDGRSTVTKTFTDAKEVSVLDYMVSNIMVIANFFETYRAQLAMQDLLDSNPDLKEAVEKAYIATHPQPEKPVEDVPSTGLYL